MKCVNAGKFIFKSCIGLGTFFILITSVALLIGGYGRGRILAWDALIAVVFYGYGIIAKHVYANTMWDVHTGEIWEEDYTPTIQIKKKDE